MSQLTGGMYGTEYSLESDLFDIHCGQMCGGLHKLTHNSGWYNKAGEKLGWGDLSLSDMKRISEEIAEGELFIVLSEQDSYWNFRETLQKLDPEAPGVEYVAEHAMYIIRRNQLYHVDKFKQKDKTVHYDVEFTELNREEAKRLITS